MIIVIEVRSFCFRYVFKQDYDGGCLVINLSMFILLLFKPFKIINIVVKLIDF